jgi:hypothetical protein
MELHKFIKTTLSHSANDAKVTKNAVQIAFETWKVTTEEDTAARSQLHDIYIKEHEATRNEYDIEYTMYTDEQSSLKNEWETYNKALVTDLLGAAPDITSDQLAKIFQQTAETTLSTKPKQQKQTYITLETWELIQKRPLYRNNGRSEMLAALNKQIKHAARKDRKNWILLHTDAADPKDQWFGINWLKNKHSTRVTALKHPTTKKLVIGQAQARLHAEVRAETWAATQPPPTPEPASSAVIAVGLRPASSP